MRSFRLALALSLAGVSACSFLLDTDALQKGGSGSGGASGSGGTSGSGGAGGSSATGGSGGGGDVDSGRDAGSSCTSDIDCQPPGMIDGCTQYKCGADKTCAAPKPYTGLAVQSAPGDAETADQADDIGYPSLLADGTDLILGYWKKNAMVTNIAIRKYDERIEVSPTSAELNAITGNRFESVSSSPGLFIRGVPRKLRLFAAAKLTGVMTTGMYQMDVDLANLRISAAQPMRADLAVTGYDTNPRVYPPRLLANGLLEPNGMWIQQGKLFAFDTTSAGEVFSTKRVIGFAPLPAGTGVHAALETTELGSSDDQGQTELWTRGSPSLSALLNDQPGGRRRGVATTATAEGTPLNFVLWSFERAGTASLLTAGASCDTNACIAFGTPGADSSFPAVAPATASARVGATMDRDLAVAFQVTTTDGNKPGSATTAVIGGLSRLSQNPDGGPGLSAVAMNPPSFVVALTPLPSSNVGPTSVAMTSGGLMMVAWVERGQNQALLKTKRFLVKTCQ